jgi:hypothetical protein
MACTLAVLVTAATSAPYAHHSYSEYDDRLVTIAGTLEQIDFGNPHTILTIRTREAGVYTATWRTARQLLREGVASDQLKVGETVSVTGNPSRVRLDLSKITEVRRVRDGWAWRMSPSGQIGVVAAR